MTREDQIGISRTPSTSGTQSGSNSCTPSASFGMQLEEVSSQDPLPQASSQGQEDYCQKSYAYNSGTLGNQCEDDAKTVGMKLVEFNQEQSQFALAKMIVVHELPFKFVENQGFRAFMSEAQPRFKIPSRVTLAKDCITLFKLEKEKLKCIMFENHQMVSLTTDTWTSIQNLKYMCITAHYIDEEWKLNKKILSFGLIGDHKGEIIGKKLEKCMKEWGINKLCCVNVDNASADNLAIAYLLRSMSDWNGSTLLNGEFMHMRCCSHILNLIVNDGLKEIDCSISKIRAACKFVKSSPTRLSTFGRYAQEENIATTAMLMLDVPTRWNSTYLMLDVAEKFEKAFVRLEYEDPLYLLDLDNEGGAPNSDDWNRARVFVKLLKIFHDATLSFSGSLHVTANTFFKKLRGIQNTLSKWRQSNDIGLQSMATNMKIKFDKYWESGGNINYLLYVAVFLDPCYKLDYIEFCFHRMYDADKCKEMLNKLKDIINKLFEHYMTLHPIPPDTCDSSSLASNVASQYHAGNDFDDDNDISLEEEFRLKVRRRRAELRKNELERYMKDDVENNIVGFDILRWWKGKTKKYLVLSHMAQDILAIPVSTVSSEFAFSMGGRVLDPFRSSLHPTIVEALICTQNWLRNSN